MQRNMSLQERRRARQLSYSDSLLLLRLVARTCLLTWEQVYYRVYGKGGLGLRGVAFMTVLTVSAVLESTLPSCSLSYKIQHNEATVAVLTVVTATPLKPNPPFSWSWYYCHCAQTCKACSGSMWHWSQVECSWMGSELLELQKIQQARACPWPRRDA